MKKIQLFTTIKLLKSHNACESGLFILFVNLPKSHKENKPINLLHILESNGLDHFFWAWRATTKSEKRVKRLILHDIIKEIEHLHPDPTVFKQVLKALSTGRELDTAYAAAAYDAAYAARDAAYAYAARDAAYAALDAADAARDAAYADAAYTARDAAAAYAAYDAADAARDAAYAYAAYDAAYAARDAAYAAARTKQIEIIKKHLK